MKRLLSIAAIFVLLACLWGCDSTEKVKFPDPTDRFFVNDFAQVMTEADENEFYANASALYANAEAKPQVVIVTVEDLDGLEPYEYATEIGTAWGVGDQDGDNGVVILLSENDREIFVSVGYGLEGDLPDSKTGRIIDIYGIPYFREDNFSAGLLAVGNAILNEVSVVYGITPENYVAIEDITAEDDVDMGNVAVSWLALIIILIILGLFSRRTGMGMFFFGMPGGHSGGFRSGGGSSFGGFSGGGGSFGGGGAGRKF